jgi:hypothetical protein
MPFTISHAAATIPFRRTRLVLSALIVGTMAPDFEYFLHGRMISRWSHNLHGAFEFSLPASLLVLAIFHWILKRPVVALLPRGVQQRIVLKEFPFWPLNRFLLIVFSILVGIATHLFWDNFTHSGRWIVEHFAWFHQTTSVLGRQVANYKVAQHVSTVLGLFLLLVWFLHWYRTQPTHELPGYSLSSGTKFVVVTAMIAIASALGLTRALLLLGSRPMSAVFVANAVVAFVSITMLELLIFSLAIRKQVSQSSPTTAQS